MIDSALLDLLACPACESRPELRLVENGTSLECSRCRRRYPIRDGIPVLLTEDPESEGSEEDGAGSENGRRP